MSTEHASGAGTRVKKQAFGIRRDADGHWYTGGVDGEEPVFSADKDEAMEFDHDEAETELMSGEWPECQIVVLYEYFGRAPNA